MDPILAEVVAQIHATPRKIVLVVTGGGSGAIAQLLAVPGGSQTLLEALVPYASRSLIDFLGAEPEHYCTAATARLMAMQGYHRAMQLRAGGEPVAGVACTASLVSDRPKRGPHRCHIAVQDGRSTTTDSLTLTKGRRDRAGEEDVVARVVLAAVARACGLAREVPIPLLEGEQIETRRTEPLDPIRKLVVGEVRRVVVAPDGAMHSDGPTIKAALSGAFHPMHDGHRELARVASEMLGREVAFELSVTNVDKPPLDFTEIEKRLAQFAGRDTVVLTDAPTFLEKARLLLGCVFVVGADTADRIVAARYYGDDDQQMLDALSEIRRLGCRFLVAGRLVAGRWQTLADVPIPRGYEDLFEAIPESRFRRDISSTDIRAAQTEE